MALEINEIDIRMRIGDGNDEVRQNQEDDNESQCGDRDYDAIVADCTRRVMQRLLTMQGR